MFDDPAMKEEVTAAIKRAHAEKMLHALTDANGEPLFESKLITDERGKQTRVYRQRPDAPVTKYDAA